MSVALKRKKKGLFAEYMNKVLKIKVKAAAWPRKCDTDVKKMGFIREVKQKKISIMNQTKWKIFLNGKLSPN